MKKRILLISITLLLILTIGCGSEKANNVGNTEEIEEVEVVEESDVENRSYSVKREDLGEFTTIKKVENKNISAENKDIKLSITDYSLNQLKPKEEYKNLYKELGVENPEEVSILDIKFDFENLSNEILEVQSLGAVLTTNKGEEVNLILEFFESNSENGFKFSEKEVKKGSTSAILNSKAEDIESFKISYSESIVLELSFQ